MEIETPPERPPLPNPEPIKTYSIKWKVIGPDRLPEGDDWILFALTPEDYERLSLTTADILRFVREAMWRLRYYRDELPATEPAPAKE